jgi:2-hydroxychromene-2-carboxylate isomerase
MKSLTFYFDFISNNAYLAWTQLPALCAQHQLVCEPVPILFAGLLNAHGNVGPAEIPAKRDWMLKNILRKCAQLDVAMAPPASHPFNPLPALRAASMPLDPEQRWALVDALFEAIWVRSQPAEEEAVLRDCARRAGVDEDALWQWLCSDKASQQLRAQTDTAVAAGVFGIPSMQVDDELFFGYDDFPFLADYLSGSDPLPSDALQPWVIDASARRRRPEEKT